MTALSPIPNATAATAPIVLPAPPTVRSRVRADRSDVPPAWAQLSAAIVATSLLWLAADIVVAGWLWPAVPLTVLAVVIFVGSVLPDVLAARWDAQTAAQDAADAAEVSA